MDRPLTGFGRRAGVAALALAAVVPLTTPTSSLTATPSGSPSPFDRGHTAEAAPADEPLSAAVDDTLATVAAEARKAVVLLDVETASGSRQGSGFIVKPDGRIFTNHHVIEGARHIEVKLASGDVYERVAILGTDERRDIAVLEIPGFRLPTIPLGNSDSVRVGAPVLAIGSPLGLENTVSTGIVSARRSEPEGFDLLQITAPTSQGSSGGVVISKGGEAIGIAVSQMRQGQNLNFAVPINYARGLLGHLDGRPEAVLTPRSRDSRDSRLTTGDAEPSGVNTGLAFDLEGFRGYRAETEGSLGDDRRRRARVSYRRIEAVGEPPTLERYAESVVTERTGPFDSPQTVRRVRSRTIVSAEDLSPLSVEGEIASWNGEEWQRRRYELRFDGTHVTGTIVDATGDAREIDRDVPPGTLLSSTRHLAFATLAADSLVGRSVELVTLNPSTGKMRTDRYDILGTTTVTVRGREHTALEVNLASGLDNMTAYFRRASPRLLLRREADSGDASVRVSSYEVLGTGDVPHRPAAGEAEGGG